MIDNPLVKKSWVSHEVQRDGTIKTILHVVPTTASPPGSPLETALAEIIVEFMKTHNNIDRTDVHP